MKKVTLLIAGLFLFNLCFSQDYLARARTGKEWGQQAADMLRQDIAEYLLQEDQLVPERQELEGFFSQIDNLRDDTDRLFARIERLKNQLNNS